MKRSKTSKKAKGKLINPLLKGTAERPRISVFRSNRYIYGQAIDDIKGHTIAAYSSLKLRVNKKGKKESKIEEAREVGKKLAEILRKKKIKKVIFDRGRYSYKGKVKSLAEGLREGGLEV